MEDIIKERLNKQSSIGFNADLKDKYDKETNLLEQVTVDDLRKYGMIPEFLGRLPIVYSLESLTKEMLVDIIRKPKNAILKQYKKLLEIDEVELEFDNSALEAIAQKALEKKTGARALRSIIEEYMLDIMYEMIYRTKFNDYKRLKEIIARVKSRLETSMTNSGHTVALISGMAQFSERGYYSDKIRGYGYYELIEKLNRDFDDCKEQIVANLKECVKLIFHKENLIVSFTADDDGFSHLVKPMEQFEKGLKKLRRPSAQRLYKPCKVKKAFTFSSQVNYVARCGNFVNAGYMYTGALKVLKVIFSYDYLWINIRVKGGAYGCMSAFARSGDMYMVSYRDPNIRKTNEIYEDAADYIKKFNASDRDMLKFIIGTIGDMDAPMNPSSKGIRSFSAYISKYTRKKERKF